MISTYKVIGFNLTLNEDQTIKVEPYKTNNNVSQYDEVILEAFITNPLSASSVKVTITLPDGYKLLPIHLTPSLHDPHKFRLRLNECIGYRIIPGELTELKVEFEVLSGDDGEIVNKSSEQAASFKLYKTNTDILYAPDDIDDLFIGLNKTMQKLADIEANSEGIYVEANPIGQAKSTLNSIKIADTIYDLGSVTLNNYYTKDETNSLIDTKIAAIPGLDLSDYYKKSETYSQGQVNTLIDTKIAAIPGTDLSNYYTIDQTNTAIDNKIANIPGTDLSNYYTIEQTNNTIDTKIAAIPGTDLSNYYTSEQTDAAINSAISGKQNTLVSGSNIKTINGKSLLGSGDMKLEYPILDLGSRKTSDEFTLTQDEINTLFGYPSPEVKVQIANYNVSIYKYDEELSGDKVYYTNVLIYQDGKRYHVNLDVNKNTKKAIIYRTEEHIVSKEHVDSEITRLDNTIQLLDENTVEVRVVPISGTHISQSEAREIIEAYKDYEGAEIQFYTNGDNPTNYVEKGWVMADSSFNPHLIVEDSKYRYEYDTQGFRIISSTREELDGKQDTLVGTQTTGQNIKTINGESILGTGNIKIENGTSGTDGREIELRVSGNYIQWHYVGDSNWTNLIDLASLAGAPGNDGREIELQVANGFIQWHYKDEVSWTNLIAVASLVGDKGKDGNGIASMSFQGNDLTVSYTDGTTSNLGPIPGGGSGAGLQRVTLFQGVGDTQGQFTVVNDCKLIIFDIFTMNRHYFLSIPADVDYERENLCLSVEYEYNITIDYDGSRFSATANRDLVINNVNVYGFK